MFCTKCGTDNDDSARFCVSCGATMSCPQDAAPQSDVQPNAQPNVSVDNGAAPAPKKANAWSSILMVYLGVTIICNLVYGFMKIATFLFFGVGLYVWVFGELDGILIMLSDILSGIGLVAIAVFEVFVIVNLVKRKAKAPLLVIVFNVVCIAAPVIYLLATTLIHGFLSVSWYITFLIISSVIFLIVDAVYLSKHKGDFNK